MSETITYTHERSEDLCYCKPGFTGHVHGAKISAEDWAKGVLAIAELSRGNMATWAPKLSAKNRRAAEAIMKRKGAK